IPGADSLITLGEYGDAAEGKVSYAEARRRQVEAKRRLEAGEPPSQIKFGMAAVRAVAAEKAEKEASDLTFGEAARAWLDADAPNVTEPVRRRRETWFTGYLQGPLGSRPIASIAQAELVAAAESPLSKSISGRETKTVHRSLAQMIGQIYDYARMTHSELQNCWTDVHLPKLVRKAFPVEHHPCIVDPGAFGELLRKIQEFYLHCQHPQTGLVMRMLPLVALRVGEVVKGVWGEIDFNTAQWTISAKKMKMRRPHIVPLSYQSMAILNEAKKFSGDSEYIFPSVYSETCEHVHGNTPGKILERLGYNTKTEMSPHGFRGSFSTMLYGSKLFDDDCIELQLAHVDKNQVRSAYNHYDWLPERQEMMQIWADYLDALRGGSTQTMRDWAAEQRQAKPKPFEEE
ncbi:MAG: site-specific integrase, partial [Desulfovibrio sp.]|nr:site-specific integrase [Desulfovibrio sp.]